MLGRRVTLALAIVLVTCLGATPASSVIDKLHGVQGTDAKAADDARRFVARAVAKADKDVGKVSVYEEVDVRTYLLTYLLTELWEPSPAAACPPPPPAAWGAGPSPAGALLPPHHHPAAWGAGPSPAVPPPAPLSPLPPPAWGAGPSPAWAGTRLPPPPGARPGPFPAAGVGVGSVPSPGERPRSPPVPPPPVGARPGPSPWEAATMDLGDVPEPPVFEIGEKVR